MSQAIWSPDATRELAEIAYYIGLQEGRPATAERIVRDAHKLANLIATQPGMGAAHPEFGRNVRACSFMHRWILLYRKTESDIEVLRFLDATRDIDRILSID